MEDFMTVQEVADYLGVTGKIIYRLLEHGNIPASKTGGIWKFRQDSIDEWIQQNSVDEKAKILIVDDEEIIRALFRETMEELGHTPVSAENGIEGLELVKTEDPDLVFLDLKMPRMDGAELLSRIREIKPDLPVIIITGYSANHLMQKILAYEPMTILSKPFGETDIIDAVNTFLLIRHAGTSS